MAHMTVFSSAYASAQSLCAAFSCPEMTNIALILDAGLLLASIIILLVFASFFTCRNMTSPFPCLPS